MKFLYFAEDWLFVEKFIIKADDAKFEVTPKLGESIERDNSSGSIWEWYDSGVSPAQMEMLRTVANAKIVTLRYVGSTYYKDRQLGPAERSRLKTVLLAYDGMAP